MGFRRRKRAEPEQLDKLLDGYHASRPPASTISAVASIRCWNCHKPNVYDARRNPPARCVWCRAVF